MGSHAKASSCTIKNLHNQQLLPRLAVLQLRQRTPSNASAGAAAAAGGAGRLGAAAAAAAVGAVLLLLVPLLMLAASRVTV